MYDIKRSLTSYWRVSRVPLRVCLLACPILIACLVFYWPSSLLLGLIGVCAALIANSTAAGGGVLFVPVFSHMELSAATIISTSILIQCFGMSSGAIRWTIRLKAQPEHYRHHIRHLKSFSITTVLGAWGGIYVKGFVSLDFEIIFSVLSAVFAILLLIQTRLSLKGKPLLTLSEHWTKVSVNVVAFCGAMLTPFISVGVGELVAIYLMLLGFSTAIAVATGVCLAAISLLACMPFMIMQGQFDVFLLIAIAPGAIIGGAFAYKITEFLGPVKLKLCFAIYALIVAFIMLDK